MPHWIRSTALGDILGVDFTALVDDPLYRNLDRLHPNRAAIESDLVERERDLFQLDPTVYLYDLTSTYFEGQAKRNPKAKRGYSRDKRPDCKQVVVGLVIGREGFPIAHEVFDGNTQDRKTLGRMLDLLKDRVGMPEGSTVVVDRGMAYPENLAGDPPAQAPLRGRRATTGAGLLARRVRGAARASSWCPANPRL